MFKALFGTNEKIGISEDRILIGKIPTGSFGTKEYESNIPLKYVCHRLFHKN
jgi:hypothetical protein